MQWLDATQGRQPWTFAFSILSTRACVHNFQDHCGTWTLRAGLFLLLVQTPTQKPQPAPEPSQTMWIWQTGGTEHVLLQYFKTWNMCLCLSILKPSRSCGSKQVISAVTSTSVCEQRWSFECPLCHTQESCTPSVTPSHWLKGSQWAESRHTPSSLPQDHFSLGYLLPSPVRAQYPKFRSTHKILDYL